MGFLDQDIALQLQAGKSCLGKSAPRCLWVKSVSKIKTVATGTAAQGAVGEAAASQATASGSGCRGCSEGPPKVGSTRSWAGPPRPQHFHGTGTQTPVYLDGAEG